ncbi:MAG TPA: hypothetical protein VF381_03185 [Thermoanaerobaculia bacterium]
MSEATKIFKANVIVFREDSTWTALALEMDVRGYGPTQQAALDDVLGMLQAQITFAVQMGHPESVWRPAEETYWRMWEKARRNQFVADMSGSDAPDDPPFADLVPLELLAMKHRDEWNLTRA